MLSPSGNAVGVLRDLRDSIDNIDAVISNFFSLKQNVEPEP
jgi:hypothetical protein